MHVPAPGLPCDVESLGSKGAGLCEARAAGLSVPAFVVLDTAFFSAFSASGGWPMDIDVRSIVAPIEEATGTRLGDVRAPLLLSVRSSPVVSMPGMLDTVLDVGATREVVDALASLRSDAAFALDVRRRFLESWGTVVVGLPRARFHETFGARGRATEPRATSSEESLRATIARHEAAIGDRACDDAVEQLKHAIEAVLRSWEGPRARAQRHAQGLDGTTGPAVVVQAMVFGNASGASGAGVAFSRNPVTGENELFGEFLPCAQGDEVVSGRSSPSGLRATASGRGARESLEAVCPEVLPTLAAATLALESRLGDVVDVEFTVENGAFWLLQARLAKKTPRATVRVAVEQVRAGSLDRTAALERVGPTAFAALVGWRVPGSETLAAAGHVPLTRGLAASAGAVSGRVVYEPDAAVDAARAGEAVVLVRPECSPEDAPGIRAAAGVLTSSGGLTSHAAVISRSLGRPCIVAASDLRLDAARGRAEVRTERGMRALPAVVTLDGVTGHVFEGAIPLEVDFALPEARELLAWAVDADAPEWRALAAQWLHDGPAEGPGTG